jgi:transcription antitermination factor NusG
MVKTKIPPLANWYLLYTNPRAEKKVADELKRKNIEVFLPLQKTLKQWSDRKKWVEEPLFKSYVFVYTELEKNFYPILYTNGIVKFISFQGKTAIVDKREIDLVKRILGDISIQAEALENSAIEMGDEVEIVGGPLIGNKGKLIQLQGAQKVMLELSSMQQTLLLTIPKEYIRKVHPLNIKLAVTLN